MNLYAYHYNRGNSWRKVAVNDFTDCSDELDTPFTPREYPSLTNYQDMLIILAGGRDPNDQSKVYSEVEMYSIENNTWKSLPGL